MACNLNQKGVEEHVLAFFEAVYPNRKDLSTETNLAGDLGLSSIAKGSLYFPLWKRIKEVGCATNVTQSDFENADTIGDIADAFWDSIKGNQ